MLQVANNECEEFLQQLIRAICNEEEEEGLMDSQTDEQRTVFLPGLFGQSCIAWWVPAL